MAYGGSSSSFGDEKRSPLRDEKQNMFPRSACIIMSLATTVFGLKCHYYGKRIGHSNRRERLKARALSYKCISKGSASSGTAPRLFPFEKHNSFWTVPANNLNSGLTMALKSENPI